jgi:hypothetical protein
VGKRERKRQLGAHRHMPKNNIEMDLGKIRCEGMDWADLVQDKDMWQAVVNTVVKLVVS